MVVHHKLTEHVGKREKRFTWNSKSSSKFSLARFTNLDPRFNLPSMRIPFRFFSFFFLVACLERTKRKTGEKKSRKSRKHKRGWLYRLLLHRPHRRKNSSSSCEFSTPDTAQTWNGIFPGQLSPLPPFLFSFFPPVFCRTFSEKITHAHGGIIKDDYLAWSGSFQRFTPRSTSDAKHS